MKGRRNDEGQREDPVYRHAYSTTTYLRAEKEEENWTQYIPWSLEWINTKSKSNNTVTIPILVNDYVPSIYLCIQTPSLSFDTSATLLTSLTLPHSHPPHLTPHTYNKEDLIKKKLSSCVCLSVCVCVRGYIPLFLPFIPYHTIPYHAMPK